ncbi:MAG TPA: rod shape-determining protein MreC [Methylophilaceae bacterium]|jgi:rod shape-determining protein MreC
MPRAMQHQHPPAFFVRGPSPFARLVFFIALSLALMAIDSRLHYLTEVRQGFVALLHPLQLLANTPTNLYLDAKEYLVTHDTLMKDNRKLTKKVLEQGAELQRFRALETENAHLRSLLGTAQTLKQPAKLGEILHMGRDPFTHKVVVNLGARQNVEAGEAAVDEAGVIGQVTRVYPFSSEVTLITDKELAIPIQVERNGLRAIAFGHGRDTTIDLPYLPANVDIRKGDKLITSGIDGVYPIGLAVAEVTQIERNPDSPFAHIVAQPIAGIENHRQILLLSIPKAETPTGLTVETKNKPALTPTEHAPH